MNRAGLALGSNLGDRVALVSAARDACFALNAKGGKLLQSPLYETDPVDCPSNSGKYLNAVIELEWSGSADELLTRCQEIERQLGRVRSGVTNEPRPVDIDILYLGGVELDSERLTLPHPRLKQRKFVLVPLNDIRPELVLPGSRVSIADLTGDIGGQEPDPVLFSADW